MGKQVTIKYAGKDLTYEVMDDFTQYVSEVDVAERGGVQAAMQGLTDNTIKGIKATLSLILALGHTDVKVTSMVRNGPSDNQNSQHYIGTAFDIVDKSGDESWYTDFMDQVGLYSDDFSYQTQNDTLQAWYTAVAHEGTGWHVHFDNYLGGLGGETDEEKKQMKADCARTGGGGGTRHVTPGGGGGSQAGNFRNIKDLGNAVEITPSKKTYCEPVYPDYLYVAGNIPCSVVEPTVVNRTKGMEKSGDYSIMTGQDMQDITGLDFNAYTTDQAQVYAQRPFDATKSVSEIKVPSAGKPLNNNDPYPVDLKIEELELHMPRVKQYKLPYSKKVANQKTLASAILTLSDFTEKRIVKLENVLATMMRYTFGMGKRMFINCQYYGGQDLSSKYLTIRCMNDSRTDDGQVMQIDQCLSCSRFEPIIGQRYDVLNEIGTSLASIEDDIQCGYMNMEDYINFVRVEKMHDKKGDYQLNYKNTEKRNENERPFSEQWDAGVKMSWKMTPVEQQKPQINWRQNINMDDKSPEKLDSYPLKNGPAQGANPGCTLTGGDYKDSIDKHKIFMDEVLAGKHDNDSLDLSGGKDDKNKDNKTDTPKSRRSPYVLRSPDGNGDNQNQNKEQWEKVKQAIQAGFAQIPESVIEDSVNNLKSYGYEQALQNECKKQGVDPVMAMALAVIKSHGNLEINGGLWGSQGGDAATQITDGVKKIKELITKYNKEGNPISVGTAFNSWNDELDKLNNSKRVFDPAWVLAIDGDTYFFPAVVMAYIGIDAAHTGLSQLKDNDTDTDFPIKTSDLTQTYMTQDFGATNVASGVAVISNAIIFSLPAGTELHAPSQCDCSEAKKDDELGSYVEVTDKSSGDVYVFGGIDGGTVAKSEDPIAQGSVVAKTTEKFILRVKRNGNYVDPKTVWNKLNGINASKDESVGQQIEKINSPTGNTTTYNK